MDNDTLLILTGIGFIIFIAVNFFFAKAANKDFNPEIMSHWDGYL